MSHELWRRRAEELVQAIEADARDGWVENPLEALAKALPQPPPPEPAVGQLWRVVPPDPSSGDMPTLVILTHVSQVLRGVLSIEHTWMAGHDDLVIQAEDSPTRRPLLACPWSDTPVPRASLAGFVGEIDKPAMEPLLMLLQWRLTGGFKVRAREIVDGTADGAVRWEIWPTENRDAGSVFYTGPRILEEDDPRLQLREVLHQHTAWLADLATGELWERFGADEQVPWFEQVLMRLRIALEQLRPPALKPSTDSTWPGEMLDSLGPVRCTLAPDVGRGVPARLVGTTAGLVGTAAGVVVGTLSGLRSAATAAVPAANAEDQGDCERFAVEVDGVMAQVSLDATRSGELSLTVQAADQGAPFKGLRVAIRAMGPEGRLKKDDTTDERGMAWIGPVAIDLDHPIELILGRGPGKRVIRF